MSSVFRVGLVVSVSALSGCLAGDERATPGLMTMTIEPSAATTDGFDTSDGWHVKFDRFVAAAGDVSLETPRQESGARAEQDSCVDYTDAHYDRLFDFVHATRTELGLAFGLGACSAQYRLKSPSTDSLLEAGATEEDLTFMRVRATDDWADEARVALWVKGSASKGDRTERFEWMLRQGDRVWGCASASGAGDVDEITLEADASFTLHAVVRGEELFRAAPDATAPLVFDPFASADADGDGAITLHELAGVPVSVDVPPIPAMPFGGAEVLAPKTLGDLVYDWQLRRVGGLSGSVDCSLR
ncbi:MAG: hypothetical protein U0414_19185 [Polyangiaceae bacterium]